MATKVSIEEEVKKLQKHFGGMAKMFKDLKHSVEVLEKKVSAKENDEIKQILYKLLVANSDAIKRINKEIKELSKKDVVTDDRKDTLESINRGQEGESKSRKICRYYNRGYCKYESECGFFHPSAVGRQSNCE